MIKRRIARLCTRAYQLEQELLDNNTLTPGTYIAYYSNKVTRHTRRRLTFESTDREYELQLKQKVIIQEAQQLEQNIQVRLHAFAS